jgi:hypothetical protein
MRFIQHLLQGQLLGGIVRSVDHLKVQTRIRTCMVSPARAEVIRFPSPPDLPGFWVPELINPALCIARPNWNCITAPLSIMHHRMARAHRIGVEHAHREVVVVRCAWPHVQRRDRRRVPTQFDDPLANVEVACLDPATIRRQPRMLRGGVDRLVGCGGCSSGSGLDLCDATCAVLCTWDAGHRDNATLVEQVSRSAGQ